MNITCEHEWEFHVREVFLAKKWSFAIDYLFSQQKVFYERKSNLEKYSGLNKNVIWKSILINSTHYQESCYFLLIFFN